MSKRARHYVTTVVVIVLGASLAYVGRDWADVVFYAAAAGLLVVVGLAGLTWQESAPDGAWRRHSPPR
jgi:hypothetical protein